MTTYVQTLPIWPEFYGAYDRRQRSPSLTGSTDSARFSVRSEKVERVWRMLPIL